MQNVLDKDLANGQLVHFMDATTSRLAIFPRRAVLRVGMLLRDSEVAQEKCGVI